MLNVLLEQNSPSYSDETTTIRVLLADDHPILRDGLATVLDEEPDIEVVGQAGDGQEAVELARKLHPDVVIMDITMPRLNGIEATQRIVEEFPSIRVIGLSTHKAADVATVMADAGAVGFVAKGEPAEVLLDAIRNGPE